MTTPTSRRMALSLASADLQNIHALSVLRLRRAVATVARRSQMRRAVFEPELLERRLRPAHKSDRERGVDVARTAIAEFLLGLMHVAGETFGVTREAALHALRVESVTGRAFCLVCITAHLLRVEVSFVREAGPIPANALYPEFV